MLVYSGFSSRRHETLYGRLTEDLLSMLTWRVMCALNKEEVNEDEWGLKFMSLFNQMARLEQRKYHPPKFSNICTDIHSHFAEKTRFIPGTRRTRFSTTEDEVFNRPSKRNLSPLRKTSKKRPKECSRKGLRPLGNSHMRRNSQHEQGHRFDLSLKFDQLKETVLRELCEYSVYHSRKVSK